jgi:hypothetical protein
MRSSLYRLLVVPNALVNIRTTRFLFACVVAGWLTIVGSHPAQAQTAADISAVATKTCAVMSGQAKPDSRTLQYLMMLDEDMADANPVATALYHDVLHECPKAYLSYEQRLRAQNPFAAHPLVGQPTQLSNPGTSLNSPAPRPNFPIRCRGAHGMASSARTMLVVTFAKTEHPATQGLQAGQCAWLDRAVGAREPAHIAVPLASPREAQNGVAQINAGGLWTFWVYNTGTALQATAVAKGTPTQKP